MQFAASLEIGTRDDFVGRLAALADTTAGISRNLGLRHLAPDLAFLNARHRFRCAAAIRFRAAALRAGRLGLPSDGAPEDVI